ncbi:MAG: response regulator transcription factor [Actinomycetes bacterium]
MSLVLVVDDDASIRKTVAAGLRARHFDVEVAPNGTEALRILQELNPAVVVLDLGLPDIDGIDVVRKVREQSRVPIIVLSADGSESRKVLALELGADDYVTKPFSIVELVARVRVSLRHQSLDSLEETTLREIRTGNIRIDLMEHRCWVDEEQIDLTPKEFNMLVVLARRPGKLVPHRVLLQEVWGPGYQRETQYLRVYASHLRRKLGDKPGTPDIKADSGVGYRLILDTSSEDE